MNPMGKICMIGGSGRSGTTILSKIFSLHPQVTDVPELRFLIDPDGVIDFYESSQIWSPYHYDLKLKRLERLLLATSGRDLLFPVYAILNNIPRFNNWIQHLRPRYADIQVSKFCPEFKALIAELIHRLTAFSYPGRWTGLPPLHKDKLYYSPPFDRDELRKILSQFLQQIFESVCNRQKATHYLEKNTWNILWFDRILELLPESRLVHIYRDPRDVVVSYTHQSWMPADPVQSAQIYCALMKRWWQVCESVPNESYVEISLEELVANPEEILNRICSFWTLAWDPVLLKLPLTESNTGRWRKELSPRMQKIIGDVLQEPLQRLGYE